MREYLSVKRQVEAEYIQLTQAISIISSRGSNLFCLFEADGKVGSDFKAVQDLRMLIEDLFEALTFFYMKDVFKIIPEQKIETLENRLQDMFWDQDDLKAVEDRLLLNASDIDLQTDQRLAE